MNMHLQACGYGEATRTAGYPFPQTTVDAGIGCGMSYSVSRTPSSVIRAIKMMLNLFIFAGLDHKNPANVDELQEQGNNQMFATSDKQGGKALALDLNSGRFV